MNDLQDSSLQQELKILETVVGALPEDASTPEVIISPPASEKQDISMTESKKRDALDSVMEIQDTSKRAKTEPLKEEELCVICLDKKKEILLLPCKHLCLCSGCSSSVSDCPLCRLAIASKTTVYL